MFTLEERKTLIFMLRGGHIDDCEIDLTNYEILLDKLKNPYIPILSHVLYKNTACLVTNELHGKYALKTIGNGATIAWVNSKELKVLEELSMTEIILIFEKAKNYYVFSPKLTPIEIIESLEDSDQFSGYALLSAKITALAEYLTNNNNK